MQEIKISFKLEEVANNFLIYQKRTIENVTFAYNSINSNDSERKILLPTDGLPLFIDDYKKPLANNEIKENTLNWLFQKAFEEIIIGLTPSLIEAFKVLKVRDLYLTNNTYENTEALNQVLSRIDIEAHKMHFPGLIAKIESYLGHILVFSEEILSINQVRNCLVHRQGIVSEKDLNDKDSETLNLKWQSLNYYEIKGEEKILLDYRTRKNGIKVQNLHIEPNDNLKQFKLKSKVSIDINEFNGISVTCTKFAHALYDKIVVLIDRL